MALSLMMRVVGQHRAGGGSPESHAVLIYGLIATAFLWPALSIPDGVPSPSAGLYAHVPWQGIAQGMTEPPDPSTGNAALADVTYQIQPWLLLLKSQLRSGELPLWNPYSFLGQPFWANGQSAPLFPLHLLFAALPTAWGFLLLPWLRLLVGALGTRRLALALGIAPTGALLAGVVFPLSGMVTGYLLFPMANALVMVPWVLWATERVAARSRDDPAGSWRPLAICVALLALGGHPGTLSHGLLLSAVYLVVRGIPWRRLLSWLAGWTVGGALAMVHLLPVALYLPDTARWGDADAPTPGPGPPWTQVLAMSLRILQPWAFGRAEDGSWHGLSYEPGSRVFVGLLALILATVAFQSILSRRGERDRRLLAVVTVLAFSALVAYRTPFLLDAVESLPVVGRALHHRLLFGVDLGLALLAGAGLDRLAGPRARIGRSRIRNAALLLAVGFGLLVAVVSHTSGRAFGDVLREQLPWLVWLTVAVALLYWLRLARRQTTAPTLLLLPVLLVAGELTVIHATSAPGLSASDLYPSTPAIEFLKGQPGNVAAVGQALRPGTSMVYGLRDLRGDDPARPRRFDDKYRQVGSTRTPFFHPVDDWSPPWLEAAGVRWVMTPPHEAPKDPSWRLAFDGSDARVFERPEARPEAWLVGSVGALRVDRPANSRVRIEGLDGRRLVGRIVVSQAWSPGWSVRFGDRGLETVAHDEFLLSADMPEDVEAGEAIEFVYRPPGLVAGAWISLLALVALAWPLVPALKRHSGTTRILDEASRDDESHPAV